MPVMLKLAPAILAAAIATPALAGPMGSGLALTEAVARSRSAEASSTLRLPRPAEACLPQAKAALAQEPGVRKVDLSTDAILVHVAVGDTQGRHQNLRALIAKACDGAAAAAS
jgi:hypothetical protein